jgi:hypothetical protein
MPAGRVAAVVHRGRPGSAVHPDIRQYHAALDAAHQELCALLAKELDAGLAGAESKIWHGHPVWFLEGNPIVGFSKQKPGIRLMFWSGADFEEPGLNVLGRKFKTPRCSSTRRPT